MENLNESCDGWDSTWGLNIEKVEQVSKLGFIVLGSDDRGVKVEHPTLFHSFIEQKALLIDIFRQVHDY